MAVHCRWRLRAGQADVATSAGTRFAKEVLIASSVSRRLIMSAEAVKQFWQKAKQDKALEAKLAAIQRKNGQAVIAAVVKVAADAGFDFTAQEYDAAAKQELAKQHAGGEISDEQLAQLAGGRAIYTTRWGLGGSCSPTDPGVGNKG